MASIEIYVPEVKDVKTWVKFALIFDLYVRGRGLKNFYLKCLCLRRDKLYLSRPACLISIALDEDNLVGVCFLYLGTLSVFVKKDYRHQKIGTQLICEMKKTFPIEGTYSVDDGTSGSFFKKTLGDYNRLSF